jgi:hypothetical protein
MSRRGKAGQGKERGRSTLSGLSAFTGWASYISGPGWTCAVLGGRAPAQIMSGGGIMSRDNVLDAATRAFSVRGFARSSMRAIAKNTGTTIANMYNYYESKQAMFDAVVDRMRETNQRRALEMQAQKELEDHPMKMASLLGVTSETVLKSIIGGK